MNGPKVEVSIRQTGNLLGGGASDMATYWSVMTAPDVSHGEGQGVVRSISGEMACYRATGTAKMMKGADDLSGEGCSNSRVRHRSGEFSMVFAVAFEYEVDASDNSHVRL